MEVGVVENEGGGKWWVMEGGVMEGRNEGGGVREGEWGREWGRGVRKGVREGVMRRGSGEEREWWRVRGVGGVGSDEGGVMEGEVVCIQGQVDVVVGMDLDVLLLPRVVVVVVVMGCGHRVTIVDALWMLWTLQSLTANWLLVLQTPGILHD